ncbi:hypothetical protein GH714_018522 [Hevea brasiliensis]|uniref:Uncharacterized protein n=1 Tax=Hevea brasiliensis TaxID=3981 RepID=A0A6A6LL00_HEVBR|nr:hypothetical protein GH714_018522 [Hevea brasiliensis]
MDTDVTMVPAGEASSSVAGPSSSTKKPKRFEIKKWNAVALWAWGLFSRLQNPNPDIHIYDFVFVFLDCLYLCLPDFALSAKRIKQALQVRSALLPGVCAIMLFTSTASADGSRPAKCALLTIASGNSKSMATRITVTSGTAGSKI